MKVCAAWAALGFLCSAASGQDQPLRILRVQTSVGGPPALFIEFNHAVAPDTWSVRQIPKGLRIVPFMPGRYEWPDSVTLRFIPYAGTGRFLTVILDSTLTARDGARPGRSISYTLLPPGVLPNGLVYQADADVPTASPVAQPEGSLRILRVRIPVGPPQALVIVFDHAVAPRAGSRARPPKGIRITPSITGWYDWLNSSTLRFTPKKPFDSGIYAITVDSTFTGRDGSRLARAATYRVRAENLWASVSAHRLGESLRDPFELVFSQATGVGGPASEHPPQGVTLTPAVPGQWRWTDSLRLRFTPARPFVAGVQYVIAVELIGHGPSGVLVRAGGRFPFPAPIWVTGQYLPASPTDPVTLRFSAPIATSATPESLLTITPPVDGVVTFPDSTTLKFTPRTGFRPGILYRVRLTGRLLGASGSPLVPLEGWAREFGVWLQLVEQPSDFIRQTEPLTFRFNHRIQPRSETAAEPPRWFHLNPHVAGHAEWPDAQTLRFVPDAPWTRGAMYSATLGPDLVTPDGFRLADSITVTMRVGIRLGSYLSVASRAGPITIGVWPLPGGSRTSIPRDTQISPRGFRIDPPVSGSLWWTLYGQVEFRPDSVLQPNTEYRLSFDTSFRSPDGLPLVKPETVQVSTRGHQLLAAWPVAAFTSALVTTNTRFRFIVSEPIDPLAWADSLHMAPQRSPLSGDPCGDLTGVRFRPLPSRPLRRGDSLFKDLLKDSLLLVRAPPTLITVAPDRDLPAGCAGILSVGNHSNLPQPTLTFFTPGKFRLRSARPIPSEPVPAELRYGVGVELTFSTPVSESDLQRHVRISPPIAIRFVEGRSPNGQPATVWELEAGFAPATSYRLSVDSALGDAFGQHLAESVVYSFTTAPATPTVRYQNTHRTVSTRAVPSVDVTTINVSDLRVCAVRVPDSARTRLVGGGWWTWNGIDSVSSESTECRRLAVRASPRDSVHTTVELPWKAGWRARPAGLYAVRISSPQTPGDSHRPAMVVFHVTDLAVHARVDRDRATVLVAKRSSGVPVPGATIAAKTCSGDLIATGTTGDSGVAELAGMGAAEAHARFDCEMSTWRTLEVTTPDDYDAMNVPLGGGNPHALVGPLPASLIIPDRLVYRRGDTIRLRAIVRPPSPDSIRWVVVGSDRDGLERRPVLDTLIPLSHAGTVELVFMVGPRLGPEIYEAALLLSRAGRWRQLADAEFWVTGDPPPRVYLALTPERRWGARGDSVGFAVEAWNRDGTPASGVVEVTWTGGRLNPYAVVTVPAGFTTSEASVPRGEDSPEATGGARELTLDAAGKGGFTLRLPKRAPWWPWRVAVRTTMRAGGPTQDGRAPVDVYPAAFNLAISAHSEEDGAVGEAHDSVDVVALRPDGTPVSGVRIEGLLAGRKWSPAPQESDSLPSAGAMVPDTLDQCTATTTDRPARCVLRRFATGYASASFSATDSQGRVVKIGRLVSYPRDYGWNLGRSLERPALAVNRTRFVVGDTAVLRIGGDAPGGIAWLTVAFADRVESRVLRLSGGVDTVRLPIQASHVPRMTLAATIWYPERDGASVPHAATTSEIDLEVSDPTEAMKVAMQFPDHAETASMRRISITVDSGSAAGDPPEILVWALDERLAAADSQRLPDLVGTLLRPPLARRVTVSSLEDPAPVAFEPVDPGSSLPPSAFDMGPDVLRYGPWGERSRQLDDLPGPQLLGMARAGRDGTATLDVRLPDAAGRYRVIAVAVTGSRLGSTERVITVGPRQ